MRRLFIIFFAFVLLFSLSTNVFSEEDYWQQFVHYTMNVTLDPIQQLLTGDETILYRNNSPDTLYKFYMHLYPNAFRDDNSTIAKEANERYFSYALPEEDRGWIDIEKFSIKMKGSNSNNSDQEVIAFNVDDTILEAKLPNPLPPNGEMTIEIKFSEKVRRIMGRAGRRGNQYDFSQWYPKVVVYDQKGWNPVQFHMNGEFYGEFGAFDVTMNVPQNFIICSTGEVVKGDPGWELVRVDTSLSGEVWREQFKKIKETIKELAQDSTKKRTVTFHAENVHDFAWSACPDFLYERGEWSGIPIHVLYRSYVKDRWSKTVVKRGVRTLDWLSTKFGRYPYPQLTIMHGLLGGGMEYPMLVMNASESEMLIVHEVGHIYFYGILANDEQGEAWMDEGFTSYQERWYQENYYGPMGYDRKDLLRNAPWYVQKYYPFNSYKDREFNYVLDYMNSGFNEPVSVPGYKYKDWASYGINAYSKGAMFFHMLHYMVGDEMWNKICHEYFDRWKFKHVNEERFKKVCEDVSGMDLDWFFDQWLHDTVLFDYSLKSVKKNKLSDGNFETVATIQRNQRGILPVDVQVTTEDGETFVERWDGRENNGEIKFKTKSKVKNVVIDPKDKIPDNSRLNNGSLKLEIYPQYPYMNYSPRDAYLVTWRPSMWYNDIDGLRLGFVFNGSYQQRWRNLRLGVWYGFNSSELDGLFRFRNPLSKSNTSLIYTISGQKIEGRVEADARISWTFSKFRYQPPFHQISLGFNYSDVINDDYTIRELDINETVYALQDWEDVRLGRLIMTYSVNPRGINWLSNFYMKLEGANGLSGDDLQFGKFTTQMTFQPVLNFVGVHLRGFAGTSFGDTPTLQDLFWVQGASPRERYESIYLRSRGAFPEQLHFHAQGGGNLRGYFNIPMAGEQLVSFNAELRKSFRLPIPIINSLLGNSRLVGFYDVGKIWFDDNNSELLSDAGIGLRIRHRIFNSLTTLRIDFPLFVSDPGLDKDGNLKDEFGFRWLIGFSESF